MFLLLIIELSALTITSRILVLPSHCHTKKRIQFRHSQKMSILIISAWISKIEIPNKFTASIFEGLFWKSCLKVMQHICSKIAFQIQMTWFVAVTFWKLRNGLLPSAEGEKSRSCFYIITFTVVCWVASLEKRSYVERWSLASWPVPRASAVRQDFYYGRKYKNVLITEKRYVCVELHSTVCVETSLCFALHRWYDALCDY